MKARYLFIGFILGVLSTMTVDHYLGDSIQDEIAVLEYEVGRKVHNLGQRLQQAGDGMLN